MIPSGQQLKVKVFDQVDKAAFTDAQGQIIYDLIYPHLKNHQPVELDFAGVKVAAGFLQAAFGQLMKDLALEEVNVLLKVKNMQSGLENAVPHILTRAAEYYALPLEQQQAIDEAIERAVDED